MRLRRVSVREPPRLLIEVIVGVRLRLVSCSPFGVTLSTAPPFDGHVRAVPPNNYPVLVRPCTRRQHEQIDAPHPALPCLIGWRYRPIRFFDTLSLISLWAFSLSASVSSARCPVSFGSCFFSQNGLRVLSMTVLGRGIQGGDAGHDSGEVCVVLFVFFLYPRALCLV